MTMNVIIAGSRTITDPQRLLAGIEWFQRIHGPITGVVCGMAKGVDMLGREWAKKNGVPVIEFPAFWKNADGSFDRTAGMARNCRMAAFADGLIAIWDGKSHGTKHMIAEAKKRGLKTFVSAPKGSQLSLSL